MSTLEEKPLPTPLRLISPLPLPPVSASLAAWVPNTGRHTDGSSYRQSRGRKDDRRPHSSRKSSTFVPQPPPTSQSDHRAVTGAKDSVNGSTLDPGQRVFRLERNLRFLKEQHHLILASLQKEIEELKKKNKDLQFHLIIGGDYQLQVAENATGEVGPDVATCSELVGGGQFDEGLVRVSSASSQLSANSEWVKDTTRKIEEMNRQVAVLEDENRELATALTDARNRNLFLSFRFEQMKRQAHGMQPRIPEGTQVIEIPPVYAHRLQEYEEIIQQQKRENMELQTELARLKAMVREILCSNKWTTEAYVLARSILQEGHTQDQRFQRLPRIPLRPHEPRRSSLPAISPQASFNHPIPGLRGQASLPTISPMKPRTNPSTSGQFSQRQKGPSGQRKPQQQPPQRGSFK